MQDKKKSNCYVTDISSSVYILYKIMLWNVVACTGFLKRL